MVGRGGGDSQQYTTLWSIHIQRYGNMDRISSVVLHRLYTINYISSAPFNTCTYLHTWSVLLTVKSHTCKFVLINGMKHV